MTKQLAILSLAIILLSCKGQYMMKNELSDADIDGIVSLSEDGLPVYLTLTGKQNGQMIKYLLTNIDLYSIFFKGYSFQKEFPKALKKILSNQVKSDVYFSNPELSEYLRACLEHKFCYHRILDRIIWLFASKIHAAELSIVFS